MRHVNITISGDVQNVGFRYFAKAAAEEMNISGFVQNRSDGTVYVEVEGSDEHIENFLNWCREGPPSARVDNVAATDGALKKYTFFEVRNS
jgi:acylphosphatase